ncbi:serine O-acetyltransferase EpsC [Halorientalis marina]|uniref:serine O-acetyltransferase EpsC n=1 Tax=Halorientalis marina TaxID=2931976 RepID=UPI001FF37373|nr:serine O-acetyltransferase EpsC [Halorientalis marina]
MEYTYTGDAHERLFAAYGADEDPFPTQTPTNFPHREHRREEVDVLKRLFFPACWNSKELLRDDLAVLNRLDDFGTLVAAGVRPYANGDPSETVTDIIDQLPGIRELLKKDVEAAYKGDPAAKTCMEIIRSYPGFLAISVQRVAHALYEAGAAEYARELTEYAKTETGIDIHPGAEIGEHFFIDHGTGVVVGETATIGDWVRLYQDVTLGALHFEAEEGEEHALKKGYKRHPDIGDHVVIGAGTKVLGDITVGDHVSIGANSWVTEDIPSHTKVYVSDHPTQERKPADQSVEDAGEIVTDDT